MAEVDRQGFLEPELGIACRSATIGIVGISGGGSHIVQQLAHNGFERLVLYDGKIVEEKHLPRLVGATECDVKSGTPKVDVGRRVVEAVRPNAQVRTYQSAWQSNPNPLKGCDVIFGAVDTFLGRRDLEQCARRYGIPLIDVGMRVTRVSDGSHRVAGQMILSMPGRPCMWCMGFLRNALLNEEGAGYGDAGVLAQVVNVNGILASAATWLAIDLLTRKTGDSESPAFLSYDGNRNELKEHPYWPFVRDVACGHYGDADLGDARPLAV